MCFFCLFFLVLHVTLAADERHHFVALYNFTATQADELNLEVGDIIIITKSSDTGWWRGVKRDSGEKGWFPTEYVARKSEMQLEETTALDDSMVDPATTTSMSFNTYTGYVNSVCLQDMGCKKN